ncbi:MAG: tetratricopeptide repeat protein [Spirochaetales bacterium]|uniref:Tetratricopeptide repeat protein n=1 Tax=Candidatus Thalassospirochaeta sargassi TaxID=3119039 RepID=A0AAJ1IIR9_9SPIO|nr:tetratricopeptide repeat protein [Spirochaetales bacterium]
MTETNFYNEPKNILEARYKEAYPVFATVLNEIKDQIQERAAEKELSVTVRHRVKSFSSWHAKIFRKRPLQERIKRNFVTDILGIRIICPFLEEIDSITLMLQELFHIEEHEVKGANYPYQHFGYESVHFLVAIPETAIPTNSIADIFLAPRVCEIQVRTILQEAWAEVEHELVYKSEFSPLDEPLKRKLAAINANLTLSDIMFQEIREYQRQLKEALKQRREDFYNHISQNEYETPPESAASGKHPARSLLKETVDALLLKGLIAHNQKRYEDAIEIYSDILLRDISDDIRAVILVHRGMAYFSNDLQKAALSDFNQAIKLNPAQTKALYFRAVHARVNGKFTDALADIEECIKADPYNLEYLTARAETLAATGDFQSAITECIKILKMDLDFKPAKRLLKNLENR